MPFTEEEKLRWHEERSKREYRPASLVRTEPIAVWVPCQNAFGINEGTVTREVAICDVCNGD